MERSNVELEYIGLDVHKKTISYCAKAADGTLLDRGKIRATRAALRAWAAGRKRPWRAALEATMFTSWVYDVLKPAAEGLQVAHPALLRAITVAKRKNDELDAARIADLLRADLIPQCYMAPPEIRELRQLLRYRNTLVRESVRLKNRTAGLLMETGQEYNKEKLHQKRYYAELLDNLQEVPESVVVLLRMSRQPVEMFERLQRELLRKLLQHPQLQKRVELLRTIPAVGPVTSLTWALEIGEVSRIPSVGDGVSYCGLCAGENNSAGKAKRGPISKKRNKHLQPVLIEAAKMGPRLNPGLARVHERARATGHANVATLEVARKLVSYLLAVDRSGKEFEDRTGG